MPGMFQGSSGQNATTTSNSNSSTNYTPQYNSYVDNILSTAQSLGAQPFQPGPTAQNRFAPATPAMQTGWGNIMGNAANYMPAQNMAMAGLNTASQTPNAWTAGAPALGAAALLVFVDCMKELPATLLLRPLNFETLATHLYGEAARGTYEDGSVAATCIILVGLIPVIMLARLGRRRQFAHGGVSPTQEAIARDIILGDGAPISGRSAA